MKPVRELLELSGPCLTLVLEANTPGQAQTEIREVIEGLRKTRNGDFESLVGPLFEQARNIENAATPHGSLVILRSHDLLETYRLDEPLGRKARVAERFDIRTLLAIEHQQRPFYLLALSQNHTRLLKCTPDGCEEVSFPAGTATSLSDAMQTRKPDHVLDNRQAIGPTVGSMGGVMFGTNTDAEDKDQYLLHFFRGIDDAVKVALRDKTDPLISVAVEHELALYKRVNTYPHLLAAGVHGAPDGLDLAEIRRRALELLKESEARPNGHIPEDFDKRVGTGHASTHIDDIVVAAWDGRVSQFFFQPNATHPGSYDPVRQRILHNDGTTDLIDAAAEQTILHGGEARILPSTAMPNGVPACAVFRY